MFRVSAGKAETDKAHAALLQRPSSATEVHDVYVLATLLLRELKAAAAADPIVPDRRKPECAALAAAPPEDLDAFVAALPRAAVLRAIVSFMQVRGADGGREKEGRRHHALSPQEVDADRSRMDAAALGMMLAPSLLHRPDPADFAGHGARRPRPRSARACPDSSPRGRRS